VTVVDGPLKRIEHHAAADENRERGGDDESPQPRSFASSIDRVNARVDGIHSIHGSALQDASLQTTCLFLARSVRSQGPTGPRAEAGRSRPIARGFWSADAPKIPENPQWNSAPGDAFVWADGTRVATQLAQCRDESLEEDSSGFLDEGRPPCLEPRSAGSFFGRRGKPCSPPPASA